MVESSKKFIGLNLDEARRKIEGLVDTGKPVRVWIKDGEPNHAFVTNLDGNKLTLETSAEFNISEDEDLYFLNFTFSNLDYFAKGRLINKSDDSVVLTLVNTLFKSEKRENERLLAFPHHDVYGYFKVQSKAEKTNLISINRPRGEEKEIYETFLTEKRNLISPDDDNLCELLGFRILDISGNGISLYTNNKEIKYFDSLEEGFGIDFTLMFNNKPFTLRNSRLIYIVDYVNPRANSIPMKKIGLSFDSCNPLKKHVNEIIQGMSGLREIDKSFETFLSD